VKYRIRHLTEYRYGELVPLCQNIVRLQPRNTTTQTCHAYTLDVSPAPTCRRDRTDFFGNVISWISIEEPYNTLKIEATSEVEVLPAQLPMGGGLTWEQAADALGPLGDRDLYWVRQYTFDSVYVQADPQLADYARPSFPPGAPLFQSVLDLTRRINKEFTFDSRATTVGTPVLEVLRTRRGVCQDFAHLEVGCLRSLGLAARYVSGYIRTHPLPGQKRLLGSDASHAWVSTFIPGFGWLDFDPTNGIIPTDEHATIGWGRDYDDISPIRGVLVGGHRHSMIYGVDVEPLNPDSPEAKQDASQLNLEFENPAPIPPAPPQNTQ
jgi:transglutaminase-like putative cysteine protease